MPSTLTKPKVSKKVKVTMINCGNCGDSVDEKKIKINYYGEPICKKCIKENYKLCSSCNSYVDNYDMHEKNGSWYCDNCYWEKFAKCSECGKEDLQENMIYDDDGYSWGDFYCPSCNEHRNCLREYESTPVSFRGCKFDKIKYKRCFGVELEIDDDNINTADICTKKTNFGCYDDCLPEGMEFVSPILKGDIGYNQIKKFCKYIGKVNVTDASGFHIHIDARDLNKANGWKKVRKIWYLYTHIENLIFGLVDWSRRDNHYCQEHEVEDVEAIIKCKSKFELNEYIYDSNCEKFKGFHIENWENRETIELRYHQGTANFDEIINWVTLHLALFEFASKKPIKAIKELINFKKGSTNEDKIKQIIKGITGGRKLSNFYVKKYKEYK